MTITSPRPLVIYHKSCADGYGAAFACWLHLKDTADYVPLQYGFKLEELPDVTDRVVYIVDFSLPKDMFDAVLSQARYVYWFDHHKTAFEMWRPSEPFTDNAFVSENTNMYTIVLDNQRSGALLTFNMLFPGADYTPLLFRSLDDYDRWQFQYGDTKAFNKGLWARAPWTFEQWQAIMLSPEATIDAGRVLLQDHEAKVKSAAEHALLPVTLPTATGLPAHGLAANVPGFLTSDVGHTLAQQSGTFALLWHITKDGFDRVKCSLRSEGSYDVSTLAKHFGGGGHKNAAGFEVPMRTLMDWLKPCGA